MKISSFRYVVPETLRSVRRNIFTSLAASGTVAISLFLCSIFMLLVINIDANVANALSNLEVRVFLQSNISESQRIRIEYDLKALDNAQTVAYISKDEALTMMGGRFPDIFGILGGENPLPDGFSIMAETPEQVPALAEAAGQVLGVETVRDGGATTEMLLAFAGTLRVAGLAVIILLGLASVVLIAMGTRISVYSRHKEIMVMKWTGATNAFIRWPFFLEGLLVGFLGSFLSLVACFPLYNSLVRYMNTELPVFFFFPAAGAVLSIAPTILLAGIIMGGLGSAVSVARFLDV